MSGNYFQHDGSPLPPDWISCRQCAEAAGKPREHPRVNRLGTGLPIVYGPDDPCDVHRGALSMEFLAQRARRLDITGMNRRGER